MQKVKKVLIARDGGFIIVKGSTIRLTFDFNISSGGQNAVEFYLGINKNYHFRILVPVKMSFNKEDERMGRNNKN